MKSKSSILFDLDINYISYVDFCKDPLDLSKVNAELVEDQFGNVVLRAIKNINAGEEIFIAFGKIFWANLFRLQWNCTNEAMSEIQRKVKQVYSMSDLYTSSIYNEYKISKTIANKLDDFMYWQLGTVHSLNNLSNTNNSCYMASLFQCISHIPALSRLLLETDLCTNICNTTFLFNYIKLLKGLIHQNKQSKSYINQISNYFKDNRDVIKKPNELIEDENKQQDPEEFFNQLKSKFTAEFIYFEYINHHLFGFYCDNIRIFDKCKHYSISRSINETLILQFPESKSNVPESLENLMLHYLKEDVLNGYICCECERKNNNATTNKTPSKTKNKTSKNITNVNLNKTSIDDDEDEDPYPAKVSINFHKYPKILVIQLKRYCMIPDRRSVTGVSSHFINKKVTYTRYFTVNEGQNKLVHYELIGVIIFQGRSLNVGHYIAYVLNSDNKWYKMDDIQPNEVPVTAEEACNQDLPYIFFYRRCNVNVLENEINDMIRDCYGKDKKNLIAVALDLNPYRDESVSDSSKFIIDNYKTKPCLNLGEFKYFLNNKDKLLYKNKLLKIKLNFWRYHNTAKSNIYLSCVPNGTCGFQLEHLLRERKEHGHSKPKEFDQYITNPQSHISTEKQFKYFTDYLYSILNNRNLFQLIKRPYINDKLKENNIPKNEYISYDEWYKTLSIKYNNQVPLLETWFYKYQRAYDWIIHQNKTDFMKRMYSKSKMINGREVQLWYDLGMLNYTKMDRSFSIFEDNRNGNNPVPYIKDYYILNYTTACHDPEDEFLGYKYTYEEVSAAAEDLNHGAGDGTHFFYYPHRC